LPVAVPKVNVPVLSPPPGALINVCVVPLSNPRPVMFTATPPAPMMAIKPAPSVTWSAVAPTSMFNWLATLPMSRTVAPGVALLMFSVLTALFTSDSVPPLMVTLGLPDVPMVELPWTSKVVPALAVTDVPASEAPPLNARVPALMLVGPV